MIDINLFINNIANTCNKDTLIREDGKNITLFTKIADFFRQKHNYDHFKSACQTLATISTKTEFSTLSEEQRINILGRFRQIQKRIKNDQVKNDCDQLLSTVEKNILNKEVVNENVQSVFKSIESASLSNNNQDLKHAIRNFTVILNHYKDDADVVGQIVDMWSGFVHKTREFKNEGSKSLFEVADKILERKLIHIEEKILEGDKDIDVHLDRYLLVLSMHLKQQYKSQNKGELYSRIQFLKNLMEKHADNKVFINNCLKMIDQFLGETVFNQNNKALTELKKNDFLVFRDFFPILENHLSKATDKKLIMDLRIKCANLPCPTRRTSFPTLFLSEKEQLDILVDALQKKEDITTDYLVDFLKKDNPPREAIHRLVIMAAGEDNLSSDNVKKLRTVLSDRLKELAPTNWENYLDVKNRLNEVFLINPGKTNLVDSLRRGSKTKAFFEKQLGLKEDMILIPRWYHATCRHGFMGIYNAGEIQVKHEKVFKGAWVSTKKEGGFGGDVYALSHRISSLDPDVFIGFQNENNARWRGIQKAIPLKTDSSVHLAFVGLSTMDKMQRKAEKLDMVRILKEKGFPNPKAFSAKQVDFIQREVMEILGTPNLSDQWWGKGMAYSEHQLNLQQKVQTAELNPDLFTVKTEAQNQVAIAEIVQSQAIPLYKTPMPKNPSYLSFTTGERVRLGISQSESSYNQHVERISKNEAPARGHHGTMHCARVTLWTQVLARIYENFSKEKVENPILLATAGAFHDSARENEDIDFWDSESAAALETLLNRTEVDEKTKAKYVQTVKEKDPKDGKFSNVEQSILHDADCLDIIRVVGKRNFNKNYLNFYHFEPKNTEFCDQLVKEAGAFIELTESFKIRTQMEHNSKDFYGDLVRLLFVIQAKDPSKFPTLTSLIKDDMEEILKTPETDCGKHVMSLIN